MKKIILSLAAAAFVLTACENPLQPSEEGNVKVFGDGFGSLFVKVKGDVGDPATKAGSAGELEGHGYEKALKETQIFVFNDKNDVSATASTPRAEEVLYRYDKIDNNATSKELGSIKANRNNGTDYHVIALANYKTLAPRATDQANRNGDLSGGENAVKIKNRGELEAKVVELSMHDISAEGAFPMYGFVENAQTRAEVVVNVRPSSGNSQATSSDATPAPVSLRRFVSRIHLKTIENQIPEAYGALRIHRVYILNGYSMWNLGADIENYDNVGGKFNWSQLSDDGRYVEQVMRKFSTPLPIAHAASQDFDQVSGTNSFFYTMPNPTVKEDDNFKGQITEQQKACTRLVIEASFENDDRGTSQQPKIFYYPITILGKDDVAMLRNTTYDVSCVIKNEGSDHPNDEPVYGSMNVTVEVKNWDDGGPIEKNF